MTVELLGIWLCVPLNPPEINAKKSSHYLVAMRAEMSNYNEETANKLVASYYTDAPYN
jgi:hypothetical protein